MQALGNLVQNEMGLIDIEVEPSYKARSDGSKMKALAWFGARDVRMVQVPVPDITQPSVGIINRVGENVENLKPGQRVVASFQIACGQCGYCKHKLSSMCDKANNSSLQNAVYGTRDGGFFGYSHFTGGFPGGQAEYVKDPFGNVNLLPMPDDVPDEKALYLSDVVPTAYHCVVDTGVQEGDIVAIWGLGPIGQYAARWCQIKGAKRVIGIDSHPGRLAFAAAQKALMLETDVSETPNEMIKSVRKMGRCGVIADYVGFTNQFNIGAMMEKGIRFIGNGQLLEGDIGLVHYSGEIRSDIVPIEDMAKLYAAFDKRIDGVEKVFVETKFSNPPSKGCPATSRVDEWESNKH
ncbi:alcohol dehydrogenase [Rhizoctonia solani]|uniref:Alcohol dehydrogenase n=1 Tax=Rhizoctonia solani TaxID=456999 RepID=A0A8H8SZ14_9AGAM|nr:alcohol dehydrogenase [Rhizoctonia solani]QRW23846.1 alcohol dehydrogenase [Rhizoctonia solani]